MIARDQEYIKSLVYEFIKLPNDISALSNSAILNNKPNAYLIWGINDKTHEIIGTNFKPTAEKIGNENLDNWLLRLLEPKIEYRFYEVNIDGKHIVLL